MADDEVVVDEARAGPTAPSRRARAGTARIAAITADEAAVTTVVPAVAPAEAPPQSSPEATAEGSETALPPVPDRPPRAEEGVAPRGPAAAARPATVPVPVPVPVPTGPGAPATGRSSKRSVRVRARRVHRVVRRVDPWSVLKLSLVFFVCLDVVVIVAGVLLWSVAVSTDTIDNLESFIQELFALDRFQFDGRQIFRAAVGGSAVLVLAGTAATVVLTVLFNLISDLVGGVRVTVVEEEILVPGPATPPSSG
ncbi:MAG: DUF3566 domain-containing protein [Acidimicrobiales bacterium]|nr:DUF3566 domain-containing protein [Acidimicrobiales bacterium]